MLYQDWSSTDSLMTSSRVSQLQSVQKIVELQEFLDFMGDESKICGKEICYNHSDML